MTCHYNPFGGGPLNDYGRALSATAVADKLMYPGVSEDKIGKWSGFFGSYKMADWFRPSIDYRKLMMTSDYGGEDEEKKTIEMNLEFNSVFLYKDYFYSFSYSVYPNEDGKLSSSAERDTSIIRENYIGYKYSNKVVFMAGVFDQVFGLKIPDHVAFSRSKTGISQSDQPFGTAAFYRFGNFEGGTHLFMGSLSEDDSDARQKGLSTKIEYDMGKLRKVGGSFAVSSSEYISKYMAAFHTRLGVTKGASIIAEIGKVSKEPSGGSDSIGHTYVFLQGQMKLRRGLHFLGTYEANTEEQGTTESTVYRMGPGIQWFPFHRLELRSELQNSKTANNYSVSEDSWNWYTILHLYF